jgi:cytochrome c oxidase cbb3-type subunit 4
MIENVVRGIGGVGAFGVISICIFFVFFVGMHFWAFRLKKPYLNSMSGMPLAEESANETKTDINLQKSHE